MCSVLSPTVLMSLFLSAEIFLHMASSAHVDKIMVPNIGLADGIINDLLASYLNKKKKTMRDEKKA